MKYLLSIVLALFTLIPQTASAKILAGEMKGSFTGASTFVNPETFGEVQYRLFSVLAEGPEGSYDYDYSYRIDSVVGVRVYNDMPDSSDLSINYQYEISLADADTGNDPYGFLSGVPIYFLFLPSVPDQTDSFSMKFYGSNPLIIAEHRFEPASDPAAVPEPGTVALVALGIGGILYRRR
ncbi:PEP-CTERM sorting domain-containing protein [Bryobacter aggregatus]|uniref:PEP-CTERM sorting domain-containing protein n=1 Tax=Bryobacter aggregatus TaxID=360054 RepID=UPI0004E13691|nr:PEP-CTERM sorting domain-containing protein [Bryobacter aggregatus]